MFSITAPPMRRSGSTILPFAFFADLRRRLRAGRTAGGVAAALTCLVLGLSVVVLPRAARAEETVAAEALASQRDMLPPKRIEAILTKQGYVGIAELRRRGSVWVAEVAERDGRRYRAVVDDASGEVSGLRQVRGPDPASGPLQAPGP